LDWRTGKLSGTPGPADVGVFRNVQVGVSDSSNKDSVVWLAPFDLTVSTAGTANRSPQISGTAPSTAVTGQLYSFTPTASDPDGDRLIFWTWNRPPWATLDWRTGKLSGVPGPADVGVFRNVLVGVSDSANEDSVVWLPPFDINIVAGTTGSATLSWNPPTTRVDGSPLTNLAGYRILWGTSPGNYTRSVKLSNPGLTSYVAQNLAPATYYFVIVAFDSDGLESDHSDAAQKTISQ
jgi:hypothetical protein